MLNPNPRIIYPKTILTSPRSRKIIHAKLPSSSRMPSSGCYVSVTIYSYLVAYHSPTSGSEREHFKSKMVLSFRKYCWLGWGNIAEKMCGLLHVTMHGLAAGNNVRRGEPLVSIDVVIVASGDAYESDS
ncbi:hypothetical protein GQ457_15G000590 [Hibiscus cannabinus]